MKNVSAMPSPTPPIARTGTEAGIASRISCGVHSRPKTAKQTTSGDEA